MINLKFIDSKENLKLEDTVVIFSDQKRNIDTYLQKLDKENSAIISKTISEELEVKFAANKTLTLLENEKILNILIISLGDVQKLTEIKLEELGAKCFNLLNSNIKSAKASIVIPNLGAQIKEEKLSGILALGIQNSSYRFHKFFSETKRKEKSIKTEELSIITNNTQSCVSYFQSYYEPLIQGIKLAKDLVNYPPNHLFPSSYATKVESELKDINIDVQILEESEMEELGMNALLGVGIGSSKHSKLVTMKYNGNPNSKECIAFVGKGVTFDTGGISLKPSNAMDTMKADMGGSAAVVGLCKTLALRQAKVNVVGVIGLVENMPDGNAQRPGDIVTSMSGKTIEILNTDAEGRLVLADALWYTQKEFRPQIIIDLATLTGAIMVALGYSYAGCFSNDDNLASKLIEAGKNSGENLWRMPLDEDYDKMIESKIADLANIGGARGLAGSCTAAQFLQHFVNKSDWAHIDIAGTAFANKALGGKEGSATGFGVKLLNKFIQDNYE